MKHYSIEEVFQFARRIEENGADLYQLLAVKFKDDTKMAAFFTQLAREEAEHDTLFERMAAEVMKTREREPLDELEERYLRVFAADAVFDKEALAHQVATLDSLDDALNFAIGCERAAVAYYIKMKEWVDVEHHPMLQRLISEELGHEAALRSLKIK